ncbi:MAG: hypothetical protein ACTSXL_04595 [Alphaproteobacteria bacterium]|nr:MAG: hypothetical protein B6I23_02605 [Rickettsiaceae bacterium 4572_127]
MKSVLGFLFFLLFSISSFASCPPSDAEFYGIDNTILTEIISKNGDKFNCWEIKYLIGKNKTDLSFSAYKNLLKIGAKTVFSSLSVAKIRSLGNADDFEKLSILRTQHSISSNDPETIIDEATSKIQKFYHYVAVGNKIENTNAKNQSEKNCMSNLSAISYPFSTLSKITMWNPSNGAFLNIFGTQLGKITEVIDDKKAKVKFGNKEMEIAWNSKNCRVQSSEFTWAKKLTDISEVLFIALFENAGNFLDRAFEDLANLGRNLLGVLLTLWIVIYILKNLWKMEEGFSAKKFISDFWKLMVFASLYLIVLIGFTPKELVDSLLVPVLDIGAYYGRIVFEASFNQDLASVTPPSFTTSNTISGLIEPMYSFISAFNEVLLKPFTIAEMLISYGWDNIQLTPLIIGLAILGLFAWVWIKIFLILLECVLDLIVVLMLYPVLALGYVFPLTRPYAQKGIDMIKTVALTLIFYPILIVFNSRMMMAFLTRGDPNTQDTVDNLLQNNNSEGVVKAFDLSFSMVVEGFFIGVVMIYVIKQAQTLIGDFATTVKTDKNTVNDAFKDYKKQGQKLKKVFKKKEKAPTGGGGGAP